MGWELYPELIVILILSVSTASLSVNFIFPRLILARVRQMIVDFGGIIVQLSLATGVVWCRLLLRDILRR